MARDYLTYTYDASGRRIGAGGSLAQVSLPTAQTFQIGPGNRVIQANGQSLSYDVSGNLLTDGTNTYTWNARNQLTGITGANSGSFAYDAFGRRMNKTIAGQATSYLHDGDNPFTMTTSGATGTQLSAGTDQWLSTTIDGTPKYYISDALGSVVALVDASGNMVTQYSYEAYGATTQTGAISANPFRYTGRENDGTGLYYYRARYYSPTLMRFVSEDPIGLKGGVNLYAYVGGNPVSRFDPRGLEQSPPEAYTCPSFQSYALAGAVFGAVVFGAAVAITVAAVLAPEVAATAAAGGSEALMMAIAGEPVVTPFLNGLMRPATGG